QLESGDFVGRRVTDPPSLKVLRAVYAKRGLEAVRELGGRHEVHASVVRAMDAVEIDRVAVAPEALLRGRVMRVAAVHLEHDPTLTDPTGLALHLREALSVVDHEVVTGVLAEWDEEVVSARAEREHDRQRGSIADELRVLHVDSVPVPSDGP